MSLPSPPTSCLESQGCQFDPTNCFSALSCCSFCLVVFCFWSILLTYFPLNVHFPKGRLFCEAVVVVGFWGERLGAEYFSWWYVHHNAAIWHWYEHYLYSICNLRLFLSILYSFFIFFFYLVLKPDQNGQWYQHLTFWGHFF